MKNLGVSCPEVFQFMYNADFSLNIVREWVLFGTKTSTNVHV